MLLDKQAIQTFAKDDVVSMKLSTAEEVLVRIVEVKEDSIVGTKPLSLVLTGGHGGQAAVAMAPFMLGIDETAPIEFKMANIVAVSKARKDAASQYLQNTTGIELATAMPSGTGGVQGAGFSR